MKLRDLINELERCARSAGDHADVQVRGEVEIDNPEGSDWTEPVVAMVLDASYLGGSCVVLSI